LTHVTSHSHLPLAAPVLAGEAADGTAAFSSIESMVKVRPITF